MKNLDQPNNLQLYVEKTCSGIAPIKGENPPICSPPSDLLITWAATKVNIRRGKEIIFPTNLNEDAFCTKIRDTRGRNACIVLSMEDFAKIVVTHQSPWNVQNYKKQSLYENCP